MSLYVIRCASCGEVIDHGKLCNTCRTYFRDGGKVHPLPESGKVAYTDDDKVICHICGKAYTKLSEHLKKHKITLREYIEEFELSIDDRLTSQAYHDKMHDKAVTIRTFDKNFSNPKSKIGGMNSKKFMSEKRKKRNAKIWINNITKVGEVHE